MNEESYIIDIPINVKEYPDIGIKSNIYRSYYEATNAATEWSKQNEVPVNIYKLILVRTIEP